MPHAFKDLIIHEIPQFILHIAVRYVLHHYSSQDIHHCKILEDNEISEESFVKCRKKNVYESFSISHVTVALDAKIMIGLFGTMRANDPSAGSPTETLLRLLLPLNDKVWTASRGISLANQSRCHSPGASPDHSIGRSDGRCVQRAGT